LESIPGMSSLSFTSGQQISWFICKGAIIQFNSSQLNLQQYSLQFTKVGKTNTDTKSDELLVHAEHRAGSNLYKLFIICVSGSVQ
jgi:hypothetical protein